MKELLTEHRAEDKVILTVDASKDILRLDRLAKDLGSRVHAIKLGQSLFLHDRPWAVHSALSRRVANTMLDAKYEEDPDQMSQVVRGAFDRGFKSISVAPLSGTKSLIEAAKATPRDRSIFTPLPHSNTDTLLACLDNVLVANQVLDRHHQINEVMCNVSDIGTVKKMGDFVIIATGIRLHGDSPNDHPEVASPAEALTEGADLLAIGRAVTSKEEYLPVFKDIIDNINSYIRSQRNQR